MAEYHIYIIDSDGRFINSITLECADDVEAIKRAQQLTNGYDNELWQRDRKIARFSQPSL